MCTHVYMYTKVRYHFHFLKVKLFNFNIQCFDVLCWQPLDLSSPAGSLVASLYLVLLTFAAGSTFIFHVS